MGTLEGKVAIVTGAGRGVGRGIALALAKQGAAVCVAEIDPATGAESAAELSALGGRAIFQRCDVSREEEVQECVARTFRDLGRIDILVNNATGARQEDASRPLLEHSAEQFDRQFDVDVKGSFYFMRACFPHLRDSGAGRIVNLSSLAGSERTESFAAYAAAKEALRALTGVAAREWGRDGITVNSLCPTAITEATAGWLEAHPEQAAAQTAITALGRLGDPERDIGRYVAFLVGPDAGFVTGQTLWVDGGQVIHS